MRKLIIAIALLASTMPSFAQWDHRHHPHYGRGNGFLLGLGAAAIIGSVFYFEGRRCWREVVAYDQWGNPIVRRVCE
jgi:hypothetical protein